MARRIRDKQKPPRVEAVICALLGSACAVHVPVRAASWWRGIIIGNGAMAGCVNMGFM